MFDDYDILLMEEFGVSRGLYSLINDINKQITDTGMEEVEYSSQQLKDDFGINFGGTILVSVEEGSNDCWCEEKRNGIEIGIGEGVIKKKSAYEKIAHELSHFMRDQHHKVHDNNGNWETGVRYGKNSPQEDAAYILELYARNELEAKVNEMYYKCINNPNFLCEKIKEAAEFGNGNVKLSFNGTRLDDRNCILNNIFADLEKTIHLKLMTDYYNMVVNTVETNANSVVPILVSWSNQRNFPFKFTSPNPKRAKKELMDQMVEIRNEYVESLVKVMKNLIKEFVKSFFNKGQNAEQGSQQETQEGPQQQQQGQPTNNRFEEYSETSMSESRSIKHKRILKEEKDMKAIVLKFVNKLEGYKTAVKNLHWNSKNMSQHKLFDEVADSLADFQDKVSEVEQSMSGRLPMNRLSGTKYEISTPQQMLKDLFNDVMSFYKGLEKLGDDYVGMRSDCEAYLSEIQRQQYLLDFTLKEGLRRRLQRALKD